MTEWVKRLQGYVKIRVWGFAPQRFINLCSNKGILLWNIEKQEDVYTMCIGLRSFYEGGLLFYNSFFPLLPTGSELLLTSHFLTGGLAICKFFMELEQLLLQTGKMAGMSDIGFFFIR